MNCKKFVLVSPNFAPEDTAIGLYNTQLTDYLAQDNIDIKVITGFPYYPAWEIQNSYLSKPDFHQEMRGAKTAVLRYRQYVPKVPSFLKRIFHIISFSFGTLVNLCKIKQPDVIFAVIPFTATAFLSLIFARLKGAKLWVHIQDFEFDAARQVLVKKKRYNFIFKILSCLEHYVLSKADYVSSISHAMCQMVTDKTGRQDPYYLPNWIDPNDINPQMVEKHPYVANHAGKFTVLYSGNIGEKQDWDIFVELVQKTSIHRHIHFVVVGGGGYKKTLQQRCETFDNISFYPLVSFNELGGLLCAPDMHILCQKIDVADTMMPSKLIGMFASSKPSLVSGNINSELGRIFQQADIGFFIETHKSDDLMAAILECAHNQDKATQIGQRARDYILNNFSREKILQNFKAQLG